MPRTHVFSLPGGQLELVAGSLASPPRRVDALVSADDNHLSHGGGVSEALWRAAGPALEAEVLRNRPRLALGDVFVSPPGALPCRVLLHAITIDFDANRIMTARELPALYRDVIRTAQGQGCASVGLPLLASGAAGITVPESAQALADALSSATTDGPVPSLLISVLSEKFGEVDRALSTSLAEAFGGVRERIASALKSLPGDDDGAILRRWYGSQGDRRVALAVALEAVVDVARARVSSLHAWDPHLERIRGCVAELRLAASSLAQGRGIAPGAADVRTAEAAILHTAAVLREAALSSGRKGVRRQRAGALFHQSQDLSVGSPVQAKPASAPEPPPPTPAPPTPRPVAASTMTASGGSAPSRALHRLVLERLSPENLRRLQALLDEQGYKGEPEFRVLEFLVMRDPPQVLRDLFSLVELRSLLEDVYGERPPAALTLDQLVDRVLLRLGFDLPRVPKGLGAARERARVALKRIHGARQAAAVVGEVAQLASWLECLCLVLLRFVSQILYELPPEVLLHDWKKLKPNQPLDQAGLGQLLGFVSTLDARIRKDPPSRLALFDLDPGRLLPPHGIGLLPELRNNLVHFRPDAVVSLEDVRRKALAFVEAAERLIGHLETQSHRVFPRIIAIRGIQHDAWGRRLVIAEDEDGGSETIFTDVEVRPGELYFMQPLSNPARVDPLLVPAGDFRFPD